jgi:hypothetical protein
MSKYSKNYKPDLIPQKSKLLEILARWEVLWRTDADESSILQV